MLGWHRPAFIRLGGRVGQILTQVPVDVAVFIDLGQERLEKLLVPYAANIHDELGLELALRLLFDSDMRRLTILRVAPVGQTPGELSNDLLL